jgi:hypothetical protein
VFKLKEENSAQSDQISELRSKIDANRESAEKAQAAQALIIENLTAEIRASAEKLAALHKTHSNTSQQLESLSTTVAKQEAAQAAISASPYLRASSNTQQTTSAAPSPFLRASDIQWAAGEQQQQQQQPRTLSNPSGSSTISLPIGPAAPSPMIRSLVTPAPAPIMTAPSQGWVGGPPQTLTATGQGWVSGPTQTLTTAGQGWVSGPTQTLGQGWVSGPTQTLSSYGIHPQGVITYR